jgi:hypothetical protein
MKMAKILACAAIAGGLWSAVPVSAQTIGTFRWQVQPYCNVIAVTVVQQGGQYQLDGTDDQCGAAQAAGVRGMAFLNPNGTIGFGLTVVTAPGGTPVHVDATINFPDLNGTWRDSAGNTGTWVFTPGAPAPGLPPRPVPPGGLAPGSVTTVQIATAAVTNSLIAANAVTSASIENGTITNADLAAPPQLQSLATLSVSTLTTTPSAIRSITVTAPAPGRVSVTVSGNFQLTSTVTGDVAQCSLTAGTSIESAGRVEGRTNFVGTTYVPFSITRVFTVPAGPFTANLVCRSYGTGNIAAYEVQTSALYVAQ